jgi:DNA-directed RNA polymerase II subunit RPB2
MTDTNMEPAAYDPWTILRSYFKGQHLSRCVRHQLESYNHFVSHQIQQTIDMFNPVTIHSVHDYNKEVNKYSLELIISFENFHLYRPQIHENNGATKLMFPQEARLRNFTYASAMTIDLNIKIIRRYGKGLSLSETRYKKIKKIHIGKMPIMINSTICVLNQYNHLDVDITGECRFDAGGYFIINGSEKTVIPQERAAENRIYCFNVKKNTNKWSWLAEIKSIPDFKCISPKQINMMITARNNGFGHSIYIQIPRIKQPVPLFVLFRALGITSDKEICEYIVLDISNEKVSKMLFGLKASIVDANKYLTQEDSLQHITSFAMYTPINMEKEEGMRKKREFTQNVIDNDLFPHCMTKIQKIYFLGYMVNNLLQTSFGWQKIDDRDSYINKRIDLTGTLLNNLFRNYFNKLVKDMSKQIVREINGGSWRSTEDYSSIINQTNIYKIVKSTTIENGIKRALATGDFGIKNTNSNKVGVAQVLNRLTYVSSLSHSRRINTPIDKSGKLIPPRKLHNTQWGFICPAESPEGAPVGVVKNLSYMAHVTIRSDSQPMYDLVAPFIIPLDKCKPSDLFEKVKLFVNGNWLGYVDNCIQCYQFLKKKKYEGILNIYVSIIFNYQKKEIRLCNDAGRPTRPVLKVKNNKLLVTEENIKHIKENKLSWDDLCVDHAIPESVLEYIDPEEQNQSMIAMFPKDMKNDGGILYKFTHCEIHPSTILGLLASCIPYPDHNQSPRNTYQCAMGKQAMGVYVTNYTHRMDKTAYVLSYPMRPLVDTRLMNFVKLNRIPSGSMVIVAILTYSGYNQEDSIMFNKDSLDRGLFSATILHTEKDEDKKIHGDEEVRCKPDRLKTKGMKFGNYDKLTNQGVIPENTLVENKDIILGKVIPIKENRNDHTKIIKYSDQSRAYRTHEECYIDKNYIHRNGDGYTFAKTRIRAYRKPVIGDKFSSRHGQKGTIGNILSGDDMPFMANGMRPDIIINPHAIPSRMTIGQLKETLLGKVLLELGLYGDGTSFGDFPIKDICKLLTKNNFEKHGNEILMNGMTGEQLETSVFIGPVFYQRLKHMVKDKQHSRGHGPMVNLTRQPAEGRAREGGLRFGEMERDCMVSHGCSRFTKGRIYDASDKFIVFSCNKCGMMVIFNDKKGIHHCPTCDNRTSFSKIHLPYACKLLFQELITMNIAPRLITEMIVKKENLIKTIPKYKHNGTRGKI